MKARTTVITLGVAGLNRAVAFYQNGLGLKSTVGRHQRLINGCRC